MPGVEAVQLFGAGQIEQGKLQARKALVETAQNSGQPGVGDRRNDADPERSHQSVLGFLCPMFGLRGGREDRAGLVQKHPACVGEFDRASVPLQQAHLEFVFQRLDLRAERRLGQMQPLGCPPEI